MSFLHFVFFTFEFTIVQGKIFLAKKKLDGFYFSVISWILRNHTYDYIYIYIVERKISAHGAHIQQQYIYIYILLLNMSTMCTYFPLIYTAVEYEHHVHLLSSHIYCC